MAIIYKATSKTTGLSYIGQTKYTLEWRKLTHEVKAKQQEDNYAFHEALRSLGFEDFDWEILEEYNEADSVELRKKLNKSERFYIKKFNSLKEGYNSDSGGSGFKAKGHKTLEEKLAKKKARRASLEYRQRRKAYKKEHREEINLRLLNRRHARLAAMSPEELEVYRQNKKLKGKQRRDSKSEEQKELKRKQILDARHAKLAAMSPEEYAIYLKERRDYQKKRRAAMSPEEYANYLEKQRERSRLKRKQLKPVLTKEELEILKQLRIDRRRERQRIRHQKNKELIHAKRREKRQKEKEKREST